LGRVANSSLGGGSQEYLPAGGTIDTRSCCVEIHGDGWVHAGVFSFGVCGSGAEKQLGIDIESLLRKRTSAATVNHCF
jgi:hypothetical protein